LASRAKNPGLEQMMQHELEPVGTLQALDEAERFLVLDQLGDALGAAMGR
jgi:hypothetical protein